MCAALLCAGAGHRYVQTHELLGRHEDDGGDQESDEFGSPAARQLFWPHPGNEVPNDTVWNNSDIFFF